MKHSPECQKKAAENKAAQEAWMEKYKDHCKKCYGHGGKSIPATRLDPEDFDTCSCLESGQCPRCGYKHSETHRFTEDGEGPCANCGWDYGNYTPDSTIPEHYECYGDCIPDQEDEYEEFLREESERREADEKYFESLEAE